MSENAMGVHSSLQHDQVLAHSARTPTTFFAHLHSKDGMPQCALCDRAFFRRGNLKEHIRSGACARLGGDSWVRHPRQYDRSPTVPAATGIRPQQTPAELTSADKTASAQKADEDSLPFVLRPRCHKLLPHWDSTIFSCAARQKLAQKCVICRVWIADMKHIKQHYNREPHANMPTIRDRVSVLSYPFKSRLARNHSCRFCGVKVGAPGRHSGQRGVLFRLCIDTLCCQDGGHGCSEEEEIFQACFPSGQVRASPAQLPAKRQFAAPEPSNHRGGGDN